MSDFRALSANFLASPQITPGDISEARDRGVSLVINNRPEGEAPDQTPGEEIARTAREAGLDYRAIPIDHTGFSPAQVEAMVDALDSAGGKVLAYCRSGTRSTLLWALAAASQGHDLEAIAKAAAMAGYDVTPVRSAMDYLAARAAD
jgi:uncharacterized protein (TIGR01244 family)